MKITMIKEKRKETNSNRSRLAYEVHAKLPASRFMFVFLSPLHISIYLCDLECSFIILFLFLFPNFRKLYFKIFGLLQAKLQHRTLNLSCQLGFNIASKNRVHSVIVQLLKPRMKECITSTFPRVKLGMVFVKFLLSQCYTCFTNRYIKCQTRLPKYLLRIFLGFFDWAERPVL